MVLVSLVIHFSFSHSLVFLPCKFIPFITQVPRPLGPDLISELPFRFLISPETWLDFAILLLFYGVYFGVITKDIADMCTDRMASTIGYFSEDGMPMKHLDKTTCGICGELNVGTDENGQPETQVWIFFICWPGVLAIRRVVLARLHCLARSDTTNLKLYFSTNFRVVILSMNFAFEVGLLLVRNKLVPPVKKKSI